MDFAGCRYSLLYGSAIHKERTTKGASTPQRGAAGEAGVTIIETGVFVQKVAISSSNPDNTHYVVVKGVVK